MNAKAALLDDKHVALIVSFVYTTRCATKYAFAVLWRALLSWLTNQEPSEASVVQLFTRHYLTQDPRGSWGACFRVSPDACLPGMGSGSQAQESWHKARLRPSCPQLRMAFDQVLESLSSLLGSRADQLMKSDRPLYTVPGHAWDRELIEGATLSVVFHCVGG